MISPINFSFYTKNKKKNKKDRDTSSFGIRAKKEFTHIQKATIGAFTALSAWGVTDYMADCFLEGETTKNITRESSKGISNAAKRARF